MKKLLLLFTLLISTLSLKAAYDCVYIYWKDGGFNAFQANCYWTDWNIIDNYYDYDKYKKAGDYDEKYICVYDMNTSSGQSKQDYINDYKNLAQFIENTHHFSHLEVHEDVYDEMTGKTYTWYSVSLKHSEVDHLKIVK